MIVITGLGRCGTSFLARIFKESGFGMGRVEWYPELKAGMEWPPAYSISRDIYTDHLVTGQKVGSDGKRRDVCDGEIPLDRQDYCPYYWHGDISLREKMLSLDRDTPPERNEGIIDVIKDPRITWHPKIIRSWWEARKDLKLIILHRNPEHIITSREDSGENKTDFQDPKRGKDLIQFKEDFCDFFTEVLRLGIPYTILFYPNFITYDPMFVHSKLKCELGIDLESKGKNIREVWNKVCDPNLITYRGREAETCVLRTAKMAMEKFSSG